MAHNIDSTDRMQRPPTTSQWNFYPGAIPSTTSRPPYGTSSSNPYPPPAPFNNKPASPIPGTLGRAYQPPNNLQGGSSVRPVDANMVCIRVQLASAYVWVGRSCIFCDRWWIDIVRHLLHDLPYIDDWDLSMLRAFITIPSNNTGLSMYSLWNRQVATTAAHKAMCTSLNPCVCVFQHDIWSTN